jgi:hypothetical protein
MTKPHQAEPVSAHMQVVPTCMEGTGKLGLERRVSCKEGTLVSTTFAMIVVIFRGDR